MNLNNNNQRNLDVHDSDGTATDGSASQSGQSGSMSDLTYNYSFNKSTSTSNSDVTVAFYGSTSSDVAIPAYVTSSSSSSDVTIPLQSSSETVQDSDVTLVEDGLDDTQSTTSTIIFLDVDSLPYFSYDGPTCYICNGYYGFCYGDPTCETCHNFLYPIAGPENPPMLQSSGDSDSGNEEPEEGPCCSCGFCDENEQLQRILMIQSNARLINNPNFPHPDNPYFPHPYNPYDYNRRLFGMENALAIPQSQVNIDDLPPEILMTVFEYLDELSLWSVGQVNRRWKSIIKTLISSDQWRYFIYTRWPLLFFTYQDQDFYELYTALINSCSCLKCLKQMIAQEEFDVENNSWRKHRLRTELRAMQQDSLDGIYALPLDPLCCHWQASIQGPSGSPYEGGLFFMYIQIPPTYPMGPPIVRFLTKILHPNVSRHGDIGIDSIHHNWSLALIISKVLISIQSLLTDPNCEVCMEPAIGALYMDNRPCFEEQARIWTWKYAMHGLRRH